MSWPRFRRRTPAAADGRARPGALPWYVVPLRVAALVPPALVAILIARHARNVPYKDHWGHVPFISEAVRGVLRPSALWEQINEHRVPLARLVQGALAWATRWDVRAEAWADFAFALATLALVADVARRTLGIVAGAWVALVASLLVFSIGQGDNWTWGAMMPAYLAALACAALAALASRTTGTWRDAAGIVLAALAGALSFGSGLALLGIAPLILLVAPSATPLRVRTRQAGAAVAVATLFAAAYLVGWHARADAAPGAFRDDGLLDYLGYLLALLGRPSGAATLPGAMWCAGTALVALVAASAWLWTAVPDARAALVPWWVLSLYAVAAGALTAYGRMTEGVLSAGAIRYLPTGSFFLIGVAGVVALAVSVLGRRSRRVALGVLAAALFAVGVATPAYVGFAREGLWRIQHLDDELTAGATCLPNCLTADDSCLLRMCWSAPLARLMCPAMQRGAFGPFAPGRAAAR